MSVEKSVEIKDSQSGEVTYLQLKGRTKEKGRCKVTVRILPYKYGDIGVAIQPQYGGFIGIPLDNVEINEKAKTVYIKVPIILPKGSDMKTIEAFLKIVRDANTED
jgi:hypothetical protein